MLVEAEADHRLQPGSVRSCRFVGAMMRSLCMLLGGQGSFLPCSVGANHCRLRHVGWEKCGHGLSSRPRESASEAFGGELVQLFHYPPRSARALLAGTLPFGIVLLVLPVELLLWRLPVSARVASLVTADPGVAESGGAEVACREVLWVSSSLDQEGKEYD